MAARRTQGGMSVIERAKPAANAALDGQRRGRVWLPGCGLGAGAALLAFILSLPSPLAVFESKSLDLRFQLRGPVDRSTGDVVIVYFDEESLDFYEESFGRWPWKRRVHGELVKYLASGEPRAVVYDGLFYEPDLQDRASDDHLAEATREAGVVYHAFSLSHRGRRPTAALERHSLAVEGDLLHLFPTDNGADLPLPALVEGAAGLGVVNFLADADGTSRRVRLLYRLEDRFYPSLPLAVIRGITAAKGGPVALATRGDLRLGDLRIPLTAQGTLLINWPGPLYTFPHYAAGELIESIRLAAAGQRPSVPAETFKNKIVLLGASAKSLYDLRISPFAPQVPGVDLHAAVIDNLLRRDFLRECGRAWLLVLCFVMALPVAFLIVAGRGRPGVLGLTVLPLLLFPAVTHLVFVRYRLWVPLVFPWLAGFLSFTAAYIYNYVSEAKEKKWVRGALARCVPAQVADKIVRDPDFLRVGAGEMREVTILFTDIRGFTSLAEKHSPAEVLAMLTRYFTVMEEVIFAHHGTLNQFVGDEIMVIFGAPQDQPDHALAAGRCALAMHEALAGMNREFEGRGWPPVRTGIGLNTGEVVAGFVGAEQRLGYTVVGDAVNLASRLEGLTKKYGVPIIMSGTTRGKIGREADVVELDTVQVRGKEQPVTIYHLRGFHHGPTTTT